MSDENYTMYENKFAFLENVLYLCIRVKEEQIMIELTPFEPTQENLVKAINAITSRIMTFGGTTISFDGKFKFGGMSLYAIRYDLVVFNDNGTMKEFYLHVFSADFLINLYVEYIGTCKGNLTDSAYNDVIDYMKSEMCEPVYILVCLCHDVDENQVTVTPFRKKSLAFRQMQVEYQTELNEAIRHGWKVKSDINISQEVGAYIDVDNDSETKYEWRIEEKYMHTDLEVS